MRNFRWLVAIPLILSAFTHLWNASGFPDIFYDEGVYMRRAMHVLAGEGPQEGTFYDHPYFGQLFLAGLLNVFGYPNSVVGESSVESIRLLYTFPRILMGILSIVDTFLIYEITKLRYNRRLAFITAILFAVMPISWITRRILLDSILLPFLLGGILCAMLAKKSTSYGQITWIVLSGILLGTAIFTKLPMFTMIPLFGYLIFSIQAQKARNVTLWLLPVVLIPLIWPAYSTSLGQSDFWLRDILWQTQRQSAGFGSIVFSFFQSDPVVLIAGVAGAVLAAFRRDFFILLWMIPFVVFLSLIGYVQYFYWIPLLPVFMIASATLINEVSKKAPAISYVSLAAVALFGLVCTTLFITIDTTSAQFSAAAFVVDQYSNDVTIVASPSYSWLFIYVFEKKLALMDYRELLFHPVESQRVVLISDKHFLANIDSGPQLQQIYQTSETVKTYRSVVEAYDTSRYPYTNLVSNFEGSIVEVRERN